MRTAWRRHPATIAPGIESLPRDIAGQLERDFCARHPTDKDWPGRFKAEKWLSAEVSEFEREKIHIAFDEQEIRARADRWSYACSLMQEFTAMAALGQRVGVRAPPIDAHRTERGAIERMRCRRWWRRAIRKSFTRRAESHLRASGFVQKRRQVYASDRCVVNHAERKRRDRDMLQSMVAVSDAGDQLELWDVVQASQANPTLRRNELMTRLAGFEEVAQQEGHVAEFITLTCPSAFHRTLSNGAKNPLWENFTPRDGQQWLSKMWARARSKLQRMSVLMYGIRVAEPHHDGTPHWHMVLFVPKGGADSLRVVLAGVWLAEYGNESGAREHRTSFKRIDPDKGSACGYLAKYIAKNIDGYEVGSDHETQDQDASDSCARVAAWASAHRIRQFQQIGGPAVSVWRELRRLRDSVVDSPAIEKAREAADAGEWAQFVNACGGIREGRGRVRLWREHTGELNQYGELRAADVMGVQLCMGTADRAISSKCSRRVTEKEDSEWTPASTSTTSSTAPSAGSTSTASPPIRVRTREKIWRIERKGKCISTCGDTWEARRNADAGSTSSQMDASHQRRGAASRERRQSVVSVDRSEWKGGARYSNGQLSRDRPVGSAVEGSASSSCLGPVSITVRGDSSRPTNQRPRIDSKNGAGAREGPS